MKIDALFILAAGEGSRMGKVGNVLPKPLWPIFEKTMLELQFNFYQWLDIKKKVVNVHHQAQQVQSFIKERTDGVQFLYEPELLDVGGAVMNLQRHGPEIKTALISNVDQFLCIDHEKLKNEINEISAFDVILFAVPVDKTQGYNKLEVSQDGRFLGINTHPKEERYLTYSGVSLINGRSVPRECERVGFFQSIAHPAKRKVKVVHAKSCAYHDFGTVGLYLKEMTGLLEQIKGNRDGKFFNFLKEFDAIQFKKVNKVLNSYSSEKSNECRFNNLKINLAPMARIESNGIIDVINFDQ